MPNNNDPQRQRELMELREVLDLPAGRRVFARLLGVTNVLAPSHAPGDALSTAYNEGLRCAGLHIVNEIRAAAPGRLPEILLPKGDNHEY